MESALKEILKEEKRRKDRKDKSDKSRSDKSRNDKSRNHRSEKRLSKSVEIVSKNTPQNTPQNEEIQPADPSKLMFVYEDKNGKLYKSLETIEKGEDDEIKIFPVYVHGYNDNLTEEIVTVKGGVLVSSVENSWLETIKDQTYTVLPFDLENIVVYNGKLFHCVDDLLEYINSNGAEYLDVQ